MDPAYTIICKNEEDFAVSVLKIFSQQFKILLHFSWDVVVM